MIVSYESAKETMKLLVCIFQESADIEFAKALGPSASVGLYIGWGGGPEKEPLLSCLVTTYRRTLIIRIGAQCLQISGNDNKSIQWLTNRMEITRAPFLSVYPPCGFTILDVPHDKRNVVRPILQEFIATI